MFESYLKNFYVVSSDPTHIKMLKVQVHIHHSFLSLHTVWIISLSYHCVVSVQLEILSNLANESNVSVILREFQVWFSSVVATVV